MPIPPRWCRAVYISQISQCVIERLREHNASQGTTMPVYLAVHVCDYRRSFKYGSAGILGRYSDRHANYGTNACRLGVPDVNTSSPDI